MRNPDTSWLRHNLSNDDDDDDAEDNTAGYTHVEMEATMLPCEEFTRLLRLSELSPVPETFNIPVHEECCELLFRELLLPMLLMMI